MKAAAIYARVSSDEQREKQSIETQLDFARRYCELHGITIADVYKDDGVSGGIPCGIRPEGARLLEDARTGKFDLLLMYRVDRLSRSLVDLLQTSQMIEDYGITLQSMTEPFDTSTPIGKFVLQLLGMLAELEKSNIRDRVVTGSFRCARESKWLGGPPPLGYRVGKDKHLEVEPEEAAVIHRIFTLYVEGNMNLGQLADLLNAEGVPTGNQLHGRGKQGRGWHNATLSALLNNRTYMGENFYNKRKSVRRNGHVVTREGTRPDERIVRIVPPIIDPEMFALAQRLLKDNYTRTGKGKTDYLLRGLMRCGVCGARYIGVSSDEGRKGFYYKCARYMKTQVGERCPSALVRGDRLDAEVWADIVNFARNPGKVVEKLQAQIHAQAAELLPIQVEQDVIRQAIAAKHAERARIIGLVRKALISDAEAESELTGIQQEIQVLEERAVSLSGRQERAEDLRIKLLDTDALLRKIAEAVEGATPETQRGLVTLLVDSIQIDTEHKNGKKVPRISATYVFEADPECVRNSWRGNTVAAF
jgi:site-specific DNA recombinase